MKPAPFDYFAPSTMAEAIALLEQHGDDAKILAGGQSLVPMMNFRLVRPKVLIDINRVNSLAYIKQSNGDICIGAMARHRDVERSPLVKQQNGLLAEGVRFIGHGAIRARGTVGGSIVHADPTAELPTILAAVDGHVRVVGPRGPRTIRWDELFVTYFTTSLEASEICEEVIMPALTAGAGWAFEEFTHRHGDFAIVGVAAVVEPASGRATKARIAVAGAGATPMRARRAEEFLINEALTPQAIDEAARLVSEEIEAEPDLHASVAFRRHLAATMTRRALRRAAERRYFPQ